jgi:hypothetical protein
MDRPQHSRPLWIGLIASIVLVPALMALLMVFSSQRVMTPPLLVLLIGLFISAPVAVLVELPLALWLRSRGRLNAISLCLAGTFVGALVLGLYSLHSNYWPQMNDQALARWIAQQAALKALLPGGIYGLLSAAAFSAGAGLTIRSSRHRFAAS